MTKRLVIASTMALSVMVAGCDDDDNNTGDAGGTTGEEDGGTTGGEDGGTTGGEDGGTTGGEDGGTTGEEDGGTTGEEDGGTTGEPSGIECGEETCSESVTVGMTPVAGCCHDAEESLCGMEGDEVPGGRFEGMGCIELDAPGVASEDAAAFFDRTVNDDKNEIQFRYQADEDEDLMADEVCIDNTEGELDNDVLDTVGSGAIPILRYNGCCTPAGQYGVDLSVPVGAPSLNLRIGCRSFLELQDKPCTSDDDCTTEGSTCDTDTGMCSNVEPCKAEKDAIDALETARTSALGLPFCDPESGEQSCPPVNTAMCSILGGAPFNLTSTGDDAIWSCDPAAAPYAWMCLMSGLPNAGDPGTCLEGLPNTIAGCGGEGMYPTETPAECVANLPDTLVGCDEPTE